MFVEHKSPGEAIPSREQRIGLPHTLKLSAAIRLGHDMIGETRSVFLEDGCGCALGAAMWAIGYRDDSTEGNRRFPDTFPRYFPNVPEKLAEQVSDLHYRRMMNRLEIADWLEGQGL